MERDILGNSIFYRVTRKTLLSILGLTVTSIKSVSVYLSAFCSAKAVGSIIILAVFVNRDRVVGSLDEHAQIGYVDPDHPDIGPIGVYEGAKFYEYGLYRPSENSKMRSLGTPFNAVCREQLILQFYKYVDPLDDWLTNDAEPVNGDDLWVKVVDPDVIDVRWLVDDIPLAGATGQTLRLSDYGFGPGDYQVEALAYDNLIGDWIRRDLDSVRQSVFWNVHIAPIERLMGDASMDGYVNEDDLNLMLTGWGQQADWGYGDFSGDGFVDDDDLSLMLVAWNQEAIPEALSTVPEPATIFMLCGAAAPILLKRRRSV